MCWEAQSVITLRLLRLAKGGASAEAEVQRMFAEKAAALVEAQIATTISTLKGGKSHRHQRDFKRLCKTGSSKQTQTYQMND